MKRLTVVCGLIGLAFATQLNAQSPRLIFAQLQGNNEVPVVSSPASGRFGAILDITNQAIDYQLSYDGLQAGVTQAHIHVAQPAVNGAIVVWLCGTAANPGPAGTQLCPQSGTISGTIRASDIQAVSAQGFAPGEFSELVWALLNGYAYANVHTAQSAGGEIRGQIGTGLP